MLSADDPESACDRWPEVEYCGTVEMILTTLNSTMLITGKVIALFAAALVQIAVFLAPVGLGYQFFRDSLAMAEMDLTSKDLTRHETAPLGAVAGNGGR